MGSDESAMKATKATKASSQELVHGEMYRSKVEGWRRKEGLILYGLWRVATEKAA